MNLISLFRLSVGWLGLLPLGALGLAHAQDDDTRPPFITTPPAVVERMLALAGTGAQDYVIDLGSGDGRIVIAAASRFGARGRGIELEPSLVRVSRELARQAGVAHRVTFDEGDVLEADLTQATVITIYLLGALVNRLQPKFLSQLRPGARIVSHAFTMTGWRPDHTETVRLAAPHEGQGGTSTLYLWIVPAQARGEWRSAPAAGRPGWRLRIAQNYQELDIEGERGGATVSIVDARLAGRDIRWRAGDAQFRGRIENGTMRGVLKDSHGEAPLALTRGNASP